RAVRQALEGGTVPATGDNGTEPETISSSIEILPSVGDTELSPSRAQLDTVDAAAAQADPGVTHALTEIPLVGRSDSLGHAPNAAGNPRFRILKPHAEGGLGEVFVAWDEELARSVALKQILPKYAGSERAR